MRRRYMSYNINKYAVPLYCYTLSTSTQTLCRLSSSVYISSSTQIGNLSDYVTLSNFELLYTRLGETPTLNLNYRTDGLIEYSLGDYSSGSTYLYQFTLNDIEVYMLFGNTLYIQDVAKDYGINISNGSRNIPIFVIEQ